MELPLGGCSGKMERLADGSVAGAVGPCSCERADFSVRLRLRYNPALWLCTGRYCRAARTVCLPFRLLLYKKGQLGNHPCELACAFRLEDKFVVLIIGRIGENYRLQKHASMMAASQVPFNRIFASCWFIALKVEGACIGWHYVDSLLKVLASFCVRFG